MNPIERILGSLSHNWTLIASLMVAIAPLPAALHKLGATLFGRRSSLKEDLEILKLLDPADPNYKTVKAHVDRAIADRYSDCPAAFRVFNWQAVLVGLAGCIFMIVWTVKLRAVGYRYWPGATGLIALLFFNQFASGFREEAAKPAAPKSSGELPAPSAEPAAE